MLVTKLKNLRKRLSRLEIWPTGKLAPQFIVCNIENYFFLRIKVGVTFFPNTTLELRNPEGLPLLATSTKISTYFRTNRPNGFILYLGNAIGTHKISKRSKTVNTKIKIMSNLLMM
jgi:hypothetical protein